MQFRVDGVAFRRLIHNLVHMVCLSSKGKDIDLCVTATDQHQIHVEIQDPLGYGVAVMTENVKVTTPGQFFTSSSIFTNVKVDHKLFGEDDEQKDRVQVMQEMNAVANGDAEAIEETPSKKEPLWFDCALNDTTLVIQCRSLDWAYTVHKEVDVFNRIVIENPDASLTLQPYIASQLAEIVKRSVPFAYKFTKLGDQFATLSGVHLQTVPSNKGSILTIVATNSTDVYFDQLSVDADLPEISVLPPAMFLANVFQICDFSKITAPLCLDVSSNTLAVRTPQYYVAHQNLDGTDYPQVAKYMEKWKAQSVAGCLNFPIEQTHGYIASVCTGMKKDVPIVFQHKDGALVMTVDIARRSGRIRFDNVEVLAPITLSPDNKIRMYVGIFEKALETFAKAGLSQVLLTSYDSCAIFSAKDEEACSLKISLSYVGR